VLLQLLTKLMCNLLTAQVLNNNLCKNRTAPTRSLFICTTQDKFNFQDAVMLGSVNMKFWCMPYTRLWCLPRLGKFWYMNCEILFICLTFNFVYFVRMRRFGDISIQYRYGGSRYVSWPSAIYRDTTLTFVIRGSRHVVSIFCIWRVFSYSF